MIPLLLLAVASVAIIVERFWSLRRDAVLPPGLGDEVPRVDRARPGTPIPRIEIAAPHLAAGRAARGRAGRAPSPERPGARTHRGRRPPPRASYMERFLNSLGTIAAAGRCQPVRHRGRHDPDVPRHPRPRHRRREPAARRRHRQALVCTATGMVVAIPALMFHRYFRGRIAGYIVDMEHEAIQLLDTLDAAGNGRIRPHRASRRARGHRPAGRRRLMRIRDFRADDSPEINLIPLIDVVLCLIIFFVVTTTFDARSVLRLELPRADGKPNEAQANALSVLVNADGQLLRAGPRGAARRRRFAEADHRRGRRPDRDRSVLRADARTQHQAVVTALDALGQLGFRHIAIATAPEPPPPGDRRAGLMDAASKPAAGNGSYRRLLALAKPYRWLLLAGLLAMGVEATAGAGFTLMMRPIINQTFIARNSQVSLLLPLAIVGLFVVRGIAGYVTDMSGARAGRGIARDMRVQAFAKYLRLPACASIPNRCRRCWLRLGSDSDQVAQATIDAGKVMLQQSLPGRRDARRHALHQLAGHAGGAVARAAAGVGDGSGRQALPPHRPPHPGKAAAS